MSIRARVREYRDRRGPEWQRERDQQPGESLEGYAERLDAISAELGWGLTARKYAAEAAHVRIHADHMREAGKSTFTRGTPPQPDATRDLEAGS